ncbi:MAG: glycosyltransferase family 2 protein [Chloroflexi bacterium]|nr:glycosyltransferase family 2 protein [Chloroflexota bacterium]
MARFGSNPARKQKSKYHPARVTVVVLSYIPHLEGYFRQRLDVLKLSLTSLLENTKTPFDLLVFDNGSCIEAVTFLQKLHKTGEIQYLIQSKKNIGNMGALKIAFNAAPGEIIAYSDDDIFFSQGWLSSQLEILDKFPQTGMVSGSPLRNAASFAMESHRKIAADGELNILMEYGRHIPDEWETEWAFSTGRDPEEHLNATKDQQDMLLTYNGVLAIGGANHFQFSGLKKILLAHLPTFWPEDLMYDMVQFDNAVDAAGFLRLSTPERFTRHIGNVIGSALQADINKLDINLDKQQSRPALRRHWLKKIPGSGRLIRWLYDRLFSILNNIDWRGE